LMSWKPKQVLSTPEELSDLLDRIDPESKGRNIDEMRILTIDALEEIVSRLKAGEDLAYVVVYHREAVERWIATCTLDEMTSEERSDVMKILAMLSSRAFVLNNQAGGQGGAAHPAQDPDPKDEP
jgi:hypothetical protein